MIVAWLDNFSPLPCTRAREAFATGARVAAQLSKDLDDRGKVIHAGVTAGQSAAANNDRQAAARRNGAGRDHHAVLFSDAAVRVRSGIAPIA
ncbi:MAG: hypothetical protein ABI412_00660 [Sphingomicrobium sp.]